MFSRGMWKKDSSRSFDLYIYNQRLNHSYDIRIPVVSY